MHELSVAQGIIEIAEAELQRRGEDRISAIGVRLGALAGVNPEALTFSYDVATGDTALAQSRLVIEWIPVEGSCRACGQGFTVEEAVFICPSCGSRDMAIVHGQELEVEYIEFDSGTTEPGE